IQVELAWVHPRIGAFKLNVDGTCKPCSGAIGAGGVIRDSVGDWVGGFSVNLGTGQILDAELWGLFFGLQLAVARGISNLVIEMDSALVVHLMMNPDTIGGHPLAGLLASCWDFMNMLRDCDLQHVY
ncbi:unnamed protein product, partial [Prunus brigantina]